MKIVFNKPRLIISIILFFVALMILPIFLFHNKNYYLYSLLFCILGLAFSTLTASQDGDPNYAKETILTILLGYIRFIITAILISILVTELLLRLNIQNNEFYYSSAFVILYLMLHIDFLTARLLLIFKK